MRLLWLLFFVPAALSAFSQGLPNRVHGLPTHELYDLHVDKKGYLWIAHSLGISRYDGLNFTTYTHPAGVNLRTTDIVEDTQGRIWFHNFSGQVFYIEAGKVQLLEAYDYKKENHNPRMVLVGDELLITSNNGLFVCNTHDLSTRFHPFTRTVATAQVSIAVLDNKAIVFNNLDWYRYQQGQFEKLSAVPAVTLPKNNFVSLQPATLNDTLFLTANPSGTLYKLQMGNQQLHLLAEEKHRDFINAISVEKNEIWVHTRNQSRNNNGKILNSFDLTDIVTGKDGSTWYCSRREGLLMHPKPTLWKKTTFRIEKDDYVRSMNANAGYFFVGTQKGNLYKFESDTSTATWKLELFNGLGSIDFIRHIHHDLFIVGSSTDTYIVDARKRRIESRLPVQGSLDVDAGGGSVYVATATGTYMLPNLSGTGALPAWLAQQKAHFPFLNWQSAQEQAYLLFPQRAWSVRIDSVHQKVYAATKNGLLEVSQSGIRPFLINGSEVSATWVAFKNGKLYIATINDGLWIVEGKKVLHFTTASTLASNTIIRIKLTEDHLWLFEKNGIQVLNIHTNRIVENLDLPNVNGADVLDIAEKEDAGFLATATGVYKVPLNLAYKAAKPAGFLDYVIVNHKDTLAKQGLHLSSQQNDVQFFFSAPSFSDPGPVSFRYRLKGADAEWKVTDRGERMIRYSALPPGDYEFLLYAIDNNGLEQEEVISFPFTINKPWWQNGWSIVVLNILLVGIVILIMQNRTNQKLRLERMRRTISNDLHDDIGATLSSVNFYIDLAQSEKNNTEYLQYIKTNVNQVINSLDDLVWSINPKNDTTEQFLQRMKDHAVPLLRAANIQCDFKVDANLAHLKLNLLTKRHLYLLFKEMVNNVVKHASCRKCIIHLSYQGGHLSLVVEDDGQGFDSEALKPGRNGFSSMQDRAKKLKGKLVIHSTAERGSRVTVDIPLKTLRTKREGPFGQ